MTASPAVCCFPCASAGPQDLLLLRYDYRPLCYYRSAVKNTLRTLSFRAFWKPCPSYPHLSLQTRKLAMNMATIHSYSWVGRLVAASMAISVLMASEYRGTVKSGGLPLPGATVTAVQGEKKMVTTTDERGSFRFAGLADGVWTFEIEMLGFEKLTKEAAVARVAPAPEWELKMLSTQALFGGGVAQPQTARMRQQVGNGETRAFQRLNVNQPA